MASTRPRPLPSSSSRNPFDSSDDEDEAKKPSPAISTSRSPAYCNPFDDDDRHKSRSAASRKPPQSDARNPFDDDDDDDGEHRLRNHAVPPSLKAKLDQGTLFDEEPRFSADLSSGKSQEHKSEMKLPADSAFKKAQKSKDAGVNQASKIVEGGLHQAQKLKESSVNAFKSNGRSDGSSDMKRSGKPIASTNARNQLLIDDSGSGFYNKGQEFYDSGSLGMPTRPAAARFKDHQFQGADLEQRSEQELEEYAVQKSEDTTKRIQNCLKVAEDIKGDATQTLVNLHQQGEQIRRTHEVAHDIDQSLTTGEKLLGSLGGMFSRTWKPKKGPTIAGPVEDASDYEIRKKGHHLEQRASLGLGAKGHTTHSSHSVADSHSQTVQGKIEIERTKQDDALSDLSNVLGQLKEMSMDMGSEIARQNASLDNFQNDVVILDERVKGANARGRRLLGK